MSSLFRGEEMKLCQIYFKSEVAYSCVSQLGEMGVVQFIDLNSNVNAFQRKYVNEVRRCEEIERKLRYIEKEIVKEAEIDVAEAEETCEAPKPKDMIALEVKTRLNKANLNNNKQNLFGRIDQLEHDLIEVNTNKDALRKNYLELIELKNVLIKATSFFEEHNQTEIEENVAKTTFSMENPLNLESRSLKLGFLAGIMNRDKVSSFELMLWRFCRGNVFLKTSDLEEPIEDTKTGTFEYKTVFIIFFQGEQLKNKCKKICEGFKATIYPCPETLKERREMLNGVTMRLDELKHVLDQSLNLRKSLLLNASASLKTWYSQVRKMKAIYHTMNMFSFDSKSTIAECWAPLSEIPRIKDTLDKETRKYDANFQTILNYIPTKQSPPTFNRVDKFTGGFQNIVNAYGVPSYREINPTPFYVVTFPFLFGVMFGDAGHGLLMLLAAGFLIKKENYLKKAIKGNEIFELFFGGRYIMFLMAVFSIYAGLLYNDFFSKSANIFGSKWRVAVPTNFPFENIQQLTLNPNPYANGTDRMYSGTPYPFGIDPVWQLTSNKITFTNSLKMKFSVIIGIMQMVFGLIVGLQNHLYFRRKISIFFEFIPQIIFITLIFIYLCLMIFIKWIKYAGNDDPLSGACAPNILLELINMFFLKDGSVVEKDGISTIDKCKRLYPGQHAVQMIFVIIAVLCIPVMLFTKPFILLKNSRKRTNRGARLNNVGHSNPLNINNNHDDDDDKIAKAAANGHGSSTFLNLENDSELEDEEEHFEFGEVFVEQTIHTIEYFLGCVSHTASYLRLWALSLAHAELSEVLWTMLFKLGLNINPPIGIFFMFFIFSAWAVITVGILCVMEGLSAFLHALRLHWVEFQSKFYKGEGYEFKPFSFEVILSEAEIADK